MGKARDLFKKIRDTKGTFHAKMGSKMDRNCMILTEVEEVSRIHRKERKNVKSLSRVQLLATLWTVVYQAPPSMGFSRREYWSGLPFPIPGNLPRDRTCVSCIAGEVFTTNATWETQNRTLICDAPADQ